MAAAVHAEQHEHAHPGLGALFEMPKLANYGEARAALRWQNPRLAPALKRLQQSDPDATVTWYKGHVDGFSTRSKASVAAYAKPVLHKYGIAASDQPRELIKVTARQKRPLDYDEQTFLALPIAGEGAAKDSNLDALASDTDADSKPDDALELFRPQAKGDVVVERLPESYAAAAHEVFSAFLAAHRDLFELDDKVLADGLPMLQPVRFGGGKGLYRLVYQQVVGKNGVLHNGKTVVMLDKNWNVTDISRLLLTEQKLKSLVNPNALVDLTERDAKARALQLAASVFEGLVGDAGATVTEATFGLNLHRGQYTWKVRIANADEYYSDLLIELDAATGEFLNASDLVDRYTDAKVKRWAYSSGDLLEPFKVNSNNFYTRDDRTLVHDFFHVVNDNRNNGDALHNCTATASASLSETAAYGSQNGSNYIRPTVRTDRDFSLWSPANGSGTFGESHAYFWARGFMQWLKPVLADLGVLPASAANYPRALIIVNACEDGVGWHSSSFNVTTLNNVGEGINTIRLPERCRAGNPGCAPAEYSDGNSDYSYSYESSGGYSTPGVVHHELNHFVLKRYFDVGAGLDCNSFNELKYLHEGATGRTLPQAYWDDYYGSGYAPADEFRNYRHSQESGRPHTGNANLNTLADYLCGAEDAYSSGSVAHQAMWKFTHGVSVVGNSHKSIPRVIDNRTIALLYYWALDLVAASTFQDRYELAVKVMQIMENHSELSASGKASWCEVWDVHGLETFIPGSYCS